MSSSSYSCALGGTNYPKHKRADSDMNEFGALPLEEKQFFLRVGFAIFCDTCWGPKLGSPIL